MQAAGRCYGTAAEAAIAHCAQVSGVTATGYMRCTASGLAGDGPTLHLTTTEPDGTTSLAVVRWDGAACDPFEPYADLSQMWALGLVAVVGVFMLRWFVLRLVLPQ